MPILKTRSTNRETIETELDKGSSFTHIALALDKDPSTISKEVKARLSIETVGAFRMKYNACANRFHCVKSRICHPCRAERNYKLCRRCGLCNAFCPDFVRYDCPSLKKPPYSPQGTVSGYPYTLEKADAGHSRFFLSENDNKRIHLIHAFRICLDFAGLCFRCLTVALDSGTISSNLARNSVSSLGSLNN